MFVLLCFFIFYNLVILSSYENSLRAYLMAADFEPAVDSAKDLLETGKPFYLPKGVSQFHAL